MRRQNLLDLLVFLALLTIGIAGRWWQPAWNFTPLAAVAAAAGFYFRPWLPALLLPWGVLAISDTALAGHASGPVQASVYLMLALPVLLGRRARWERAWRRVAWLGSCAVAPATAFFVVTNLAVWAFQSDYTLNLVGLAECYARALPFYRNMLAGDIFYVGMLVSSLVLMTQPVRRAHQSVALLPRSTSRGG